MEQVIRNARVVTRDADFIGQVRLRGERIAEVSRGAGVVGEDWEGDLLLPGVVDLHTDNLERHFFPRPNIDWDPVSASVVHDGLCASVGVTTVFDSLSIGSFGYSTSRKQDNLVRLVDGLGAAAAAGMLKADHRIHWRCETSSDVLAEHAPPLAAHALTGLFSLMDHTPGQRQYRNLDRFLAMWRGEGVDDAEIDRRLADFRAKQARNAAGNRRLVAGIAHEAGVPLVTHDDEEEAHIDEAADLGATVAEFPVTEAAARRARAAGMTVVMGGPNLIRGGSYSGNVGAAALADAGLIDAFASDYVLRSLIECAFVLADPPFGWSLAEAVATVTAAPARAAGLADRGAVEAGLRADLIRVRRVAGRPLVRETWTGGRRVA